MGTNTLRLCNRRSNETMRIIVTTFISIVFGFFLGVSFPTISLTKACFYILSYLGEANYAICLLSFGRIKKDCVFVWQINLPSTLLPSIDLGYIEDKYSGLSSQALLNVWSSLRNKGISLHEPEDTRVISSFHLVHRFALYMTYTRTFI